MPKIFEVNDKHYVILTGLDRMSAATLSMVPLRIPVGLDIIDTFETEKEFTKKFGPTSQYKQIPALR